MRLEGTALDFSHTIHRHPTLAEAVLEAAHTVEGKAIHI
jgi:dihydrolipoamide dehydrogenase